MYNNRVGDRNDRLLCSASAKGRFLEASQLKNENLRERKRDRKIMR